VGFPGYDPLIKPIREQKGEKRHRRDHRRREGDDDETHEQGSRHPAVLPQIVSKPRGGPLRLARQSAQPLVHRGYVDRLADRETQARGQDHHGLLCSAERDELSDASSLRSIAPLVLDDLSCELYPSHDHAGGATSADLRRFESAGGNHGGQCAHRVEAAGAVFLGSDVPRRRSMRARRRHPRPRGPVPIADPPRSSAPTLDERVQSRSSLADRVAPSSIANDRVDPIRDPVHRSSMGPQRLGSGCFSGCGSEGGATAGEGSFTGEDSGSSTGSMKTVRRCVPMFMASPPHASGAVPHRTDERGGADKRSPISIW
jgi:hypothetical protein